MSEEDIENIKEKIRNIFEQHPQIIEEKDSYNPIELEPIREEINIDFLLEDLENTIEASENTVKYLKLLFKDNQIFYETAQIMETKILQTKEILYNLKENFN